MEIFTEELKFVRSEALDCQDCKGKCKGHRLKLSWNEEDPKFPNTIWIDGKRAYKIDDNELSTLVHLKVNFPQNGPAAN